MTPVSLKSTSRPIIIAAPLPLPEVNDVVLHGGPVLVQDDVAVAAVEEHLPLHHSLHLPHEVPFLLSIAGIADGMLFSSALKLFKLKLKDLAFKTPILA